MTEFDKALKTLADHVSAWAEDIAAESLEIAQTDGGRGSKLPPTIAAEIRRMRSEDPERWDGMS